MEKKLENELQEYIDSLYKHRIHKNDNGYEIEVRTNKEFTKENALFELSMAADVNDYIDVARTEKEIQKDLEVLKNKIEKSFDSKTIRANSEINLEWSNDKGTMVLSQFEDKNFAFIVSETEGLKSQIEADTIAIDRFSGIIKCYNEIQAKDEPTLFLQEQVLYPGAKSFTNTQQLCLIDCGIPTEIYDPRLELNHADFIDLSKLKGKQQYSELAAGYEMDLMVTKEEIYIDQQNDYIISKSHLEEMPMGVPDSILEQATVLRKLMNSEPDSFLKQDELTQNLKNELKGYISVSYEAPKTVISLGDHKELLIFNNEDIVLIDTSKIEKTDKNCVTLFEDTFKNFKAFKQDPSIIIASQEKVKFIGCKRDTQQIRCFSEFENLAQENLYNKEISFDSNGMNIQNTSTCLIENGYPTLNRDPRFEVTYDQYMCLSTEPGKVNLKDLLLKKGYVEYELVYTESTKEYSLKSEGKELHQSTAIKLKNHDLAVFKTDDDQKILAFADKEHRAKSIFDKVENFSVNAINNRVDMIKNDEKISFNLLNSEISRRPLTFIKETTKNQNNSNEIIL